MSLSLGPSSFISNQKNRHGPTNHKSVLIVFINHYFWLCLVFVAACGLSLAAVCRLLTAVDSPAVEHGASVVVGADSGVVVLGSGAQAQ